MRRDVNVDVEIIIDEKLYDIDFLKFEGYLIS